MGSGNGYVLKWKDLTAESDNGGKEWLDTEQELFDRIRLS